MADKTIMTKSVAAAVGVAFVSSLAASTAAADNPFELAELDSGYMLAGDDKAEEGKCGEKGEEGACGEKGKEGACLIRCATAHDLASENRRSPRAGRRAGIEAGPAGPASLARSRLGRFPGRLHGNRAGELDWRGRQSWTAAA